MRRLFNENRFLERLEAGELRAEVKRSRHAPIVAENIPVGCLSQEVRYYDQDNNEVARVHQYLKLDGTLGASTLPDPKRLFLNGVLYRLEKG